MTRPLTITLALCALVFAAGCGGEDSGSDAGEGARSAAEDAPSSDYPQGGASKEENGEGGGGQKPERPTGTAIATSESQFGEVLFDGDDQAIYYFDQEKSSRSECYGGCADAWPPVLTEGEPRAAGSARQGLLGTTERRDGSLQVTYAGRPLYYYHDEGPGELRCHNVFNSGGLWLAVQPNGDPVPT